MFEPLHGLNTALFTPYDAEGNVSLPRFEKYLEWQLSLGVNGFFVCGSTGEGLYLTGEERRALAEAAVKTAGGRAPVMIHVGAMTTEASVELARHAAEVGADAVSSIAPVYYSVGFEGALAHYKAIGAATDLPFFIYHFPTLTGATLTAESASRLLEIRNLAGLKFTDPALHQMRWIYEITGERLTMLSGPDELHLPAMTLGAQGAIGGTYNLTPGAFLRLREAFFAGDLARAMDLQARCNRFIYAFLQAGGIGPLKAALKLVGHDLGRPRPPLPSPTPEEEPALFKRFEEAGLGELLAMQ